MEQGLGQNEAQLLKFSRQAILLMVEGLFVPIAEQRRVKVVSL